MRDEQIYLAHKAANPASYPPCDKILIRNGNTNEDVTKYPPTDVQLLIFDDGAHAAPTLGHTRGAKFEYRAISQFAGWALAKAQGVENSGTGLLVNPPSQLPNFSNYLLANKSYRTKRS